jgi:hypothetical protein
MEPTRVLQYPFEGLPPTWVVMGYGKIDAGVWTFCSRECLALWLAAQDQSTDEGEKQ